MRYKSCPDLRPEKLETPQERKRRHSLERQIELRRTPADDARCAAQREKVLEARGTTQAAVNRQVTNGLFPRPAPPLKDRRNKLRRLNPAMEGITYLNSDHGICGFCAALSSMYDDYKIKNTIDKALHENTLMTQMAAEIKMAINMMKVKSMPLIDEIVRFTRTFDQYESFEIEEYLSHIDNLDSSSADLSIAMPPSALLFYIKEIVGFKGSFISREEKLISNGVIVGLGCTNKKKEEWGGLVHWIYCIDGKQCYDSGSKKTIEEVKEDLVRDMNLPSIDEIYIVAQIKPKI